MLLVEADFSERTYSETLCFSCSKESNCGDTVNTHLGMCSTSSFVIPNQTVMFSHRNLFGCIHVIGLKSKSLATSLLQMKYDQSFLFRIYFHPVGASLNDHVPSFIRLPKQYHRTIT